MKISYDALIQAIWTYQLKTLSKGVLHHYIGGRFGVVNTDWFLNASGIHTCERGLITDKLGKQQMYKRIRELIEHKYLNWAHKPNTFFIDTLQSNQAFDVARKFWLSKGVPEGFEEGKCRCVPLDNHKQLIDECFLLLQSKFKSVDWNELTDKVV